jgi:AcrR family transcriptional regulator
MPRDARATKRQIIDAAYALFYREGFAHISVDGIAEAAGVTKRTFYYHFESKDALVSAVLDVQHELMLERIERWALHSSGDATRMIDAIFSEFAAWSRQPGWRGSGLTRAAIEFARSPGHPARVAARRQKAAVERILIEQFAACGIASPTTLVRQLLLLIEGCNSLILIHGDSTYADTAAAAARVLVRAHKAPQRVAKRPDGVPMSARTGRRKSAVGA